MMFSKEFRTALYSLDGVGVVTYHKVLKSLLKHELTEQDFWVNNQQIWLENNLDKKIVESIRKFKKEHTISSYFELIRSKKLRVVFPEDKEFSPLLKQIDNYPPLLFARGAKLTGREQNIAVVGSRKMTDYGRQAINELIPPLIKFGKTIVSGFMYGVDVTAQQVALRAKGKTIGVLGFGFDHMYPPEQRLLFAEFLEKGATFFSPFAPHVPAMPGNFPARNAIVAGMSEGVLVVEASEKSGSLITAGYAGEFGREIWAVPGSIFSEFSLGTAKLMNQGAQLVSSAQDIVSGAQSIAYQDQLRLRWKSLTIDKQQICELLLLDTLPTDLLAKRLDQDITHLATRLIELELLGLIEQSSNKWRLSA